MLQWQCNLKKFVIHYIRLANYYSHYAIFFIRCKIMLVLRDFLLLKYKTITITDKNSQVANIPPRKYQLIRNHYTCKNQCSQEIEILLCMS